jgi:two-component sensor histidine kinase
MTVHGRPVTRVPLELELRLESDVASVPQARATTRTFFSDYAAPDQLASLELIVSELVTNSIRYGGGGAVRLGLTAGDRFHVWVLDENRGTTEPHVKDPRPGQIGGLGLHVVSTLSDEWGSEVLGSNRVVWALLFA